MNLRPSKVMNSCYFGNKLIDKILKGRLKLPEHEQIIWRKYMKHVINQSECSEKGFYILFDWPLQPARSIEGILGAMRPTIPIDFMYGDDDWMRPAGAVRLAKDYENIQVHEVEKAGHQMLFENP